MCGVEDRWRAGTTNKLKVWGDCVGSNIACITLSHGKVKLCHCQWMAGSRQSEDSPRQIIIQASTYAEAIGGRVVRSTSIEDCVVLSCTTRTSFGEKLATREQKPKEGNNRDCRDLPYVGSSLERDGVQ